MKFGKSLRNEIAETLPEWEGEFISYKELKKQLNLIAPWHEEETKRCRKRPRQAIDNRVNVNGRREEIGFTKLLGSELERINEFFVGKEEEYVIRLKELKDLVENLDNIEDITQVKKDLLDFHGEMVLLMHYGVLNFEGLLKIVKKHNKKTGTFIHLPFMRRFLQQPFFTYDLLYKLLQECEELLNQLFLS